MSDQEAAPFAFDTYDDALLDTIFGMTVVFVYAGCPHYYPRQQMEGIVLDLYTTRSGKRRLLVKAEALNLPKWVDLDDIQFPINRSGSQPWVR
jgi:hypothetical protein